MVSRRSFLQKSAASAVVAGARSAWAQPLGANAAVRVAVVGLHGKGAHHVEMLKAIPGVRIVALGDVDESVLDQQAAELAVAKIPVAKYVDVRKVLESREARRRPCRPGRPTSPSARASGWASRG